MSSWECGTCYAWNDHNVTGKCYKCGRERNLMWDDPTGWALGY